MATKLILAFLGMLTVSGCAHHRGEVAMKASDREAHVGLGSDEVKPGDTVLLYREVCQKGGAGQATSNGIRDACRDIPIGYGTVVRNLNKNYSVVEVEPGVTFREGTKVKKIQKEAH